MRKVGDIFEGRYELLDELGRGGFGDVYLARDVRVERDVALKILRSDVPEITARFAREVRAVAKLRDPHTVTLLEYGHSSIGEPFLVFELVHGRDLSELLAEHGTLDPRLAVHIIVQVLQSLREAHRTGVLHRDIKPENIRVSARQDDEYHATLLDFGIARPTDTSAGNLTQPGELIGTPRYMSPEQLLSQPLSPSSDIYSLGIVMLELLAGSAALHGRALAEQFDRMASGHLFAIPDTEFAALPQVVAKMSARDPEHRYQSAQAALDALARVREPAPVHPAAIGPVVEQPAVNPLPSPPGKGLATWQLVAGGAAAVGLLAVAAVFLATPSEPEVAPRRPTKVARALPGIVRGQAPQKATVAALAPDAGRADVTASGPCEPQPPGEHKGSTRVTNGRAPWMMYVPKTHSDTPRPVIMTLAPKGVDSNDWFRHSGFREVAEDHGVFVMAVQPAGAGWASQREAINLEIVFEEAAAEYCLDESRVYAVGHIAGGHQVGYLACQAWLTAAAAAGCRPGKQQLHCESGLPTPFLLFSGMKTDHARPEGGPNCRGSMKISLADHEALWRTRNECGSESSTWFESGGSECLTWQCAGAPFVSCHLDGGHNWPGQQVRATDKIQGGCDGVTPDFPAAAVAWKFFEEVTPAPVARVGAPDMQ